MPVNSPSNRRTTAGTARRAMTRWIRRRRTTIRLLIRAPASRRRVTRPRIKPARIPTLHRRCITRVTLHWTKLMWVPSLPTLNFNFLNFFFNFSTFLVVRQTIVPFGHAAAVQLGWIAGWFADASLSTAFVPSADGAASQHEHASANSSGELTLSREVLSFCVCPPPPPFLYHLLSCRTSVVSKLPPSHPWVTSRVEESCLTRQFAVEKYLK